MKKHFLAVTSRFAYQSIILTSVLFLSVTALAQASRKQSDQPKAILVYEMSGPSRKAPVKSTANNSSARSRVVNNSAFRTTAKRSYNRFDSMRPTALEEQAFRLINAERRKRGLAPFAWDKEMLYLARQHSEDMAQHGYFSHKGRDGKTVDNRANDAGISDWSGIAENIAYNHGANDGIELAVETWLKSPRHRDNILNKQWKRSGIGVSITEEGKVYVTQVFRD